MSLNLIIIFKICIAVKQINSLNFPLFLFLSLKRTLSPISVHLSRPTKQTTNLLIELCSSLILSRNLQILVLNKNEEIWMFFQKMICNFFVWVRKESFMISHFISRINLLIKLLRRKTQKNYFSITFGNMRVALRNIDGNRS